MLSQFLLTAARDRAGQGAGGTAQPAQPGVEEDDGALSGKCKLIPLRLQPLTLKREVESWHNNLKSRSGRLRITLRLPGKGHSECK